MRAAGLKANVTDTQAPKDRRDCLRHLAGLGVLACLRAEVGLAASAPQSTRVEVWWRKVAPRVGGAVAEFARMGEIYLASHPEERDAGRLSHLLGGEDDQIPVAGVLVAHIAQEWRDSDLTIVDGWVLDVASPGASGGRSGF